MLRRWVSQEQDGVMDMRTNKPLRSESASELERLQRELRRVTTERDILKKRSATLQGTRSEVRLYCSPSGRVVHAGYVPRDDVSASGFYEWLAGLPASKARPMQGSRAA